ncbi:hypothetical protein [Haloferula sp. BvORR071]|uniref:hypothetical protein n=1 Tax=Haloferula sp. BvORR071 TaxID=1396141 RepID=UPI002240FF82|nr:hypothetical protein [Haloferula sp. BvORR071]
MTASTKPFLLALALLAGAASSSNAVVLFTDNFDATSNQTPNDQINNPGRQGGSLATLGYLQANNVQIGNTATLPPSPGSGLGDEFLAAFGGTAYVNYDFSTQTLPLEISFLGLISSIANTGPTSWVSVTVGDATGVPFVNGGNVSSVLFRANGGTEVWNHGANAPGGTYTAPGFDVWTDYKIILSDTAGTGSAFGSGGSRMDYYANGVLLGTLNITQLTAGQGYIGFAADRIVGYDNLSIATVPEPSAALVGVSGLAGLLLLRRRR